MKGILKIGLAFSMFFLTGCANYYYQGKQKKVAPDENDRYNKFVLSFDRGQQQLNFYTYGDYVFNRIEKEYIFFKNSEMKRLLRDRIPQKETEQFLFMFTHQPTYANILGFYYKDVFVKDLKNNESELDEKQPENQILTRYSFGKFQVFDCCKNVEGGLIRFIAINNPEVTDDADYKKFEREIHTIFFDANNWIASLPVSEIKPELIWYDSIVVHEIEKDRENPEQYRIALGISAQVFYLAPKTENYAQLLDKITKSYQDQKPVKIGIEKKTNRIKEVVPTDKK